MPVEGKPVNTTLPVANVHVGGVIVPIVGAEGIGGCGFITTAPDGGDIHPFELVTVKVYVPGRSAEIAVLVPVPDIVTPPGLMVNIQVPVEGNPLKTTLPVDIAHVV